MAEDNQVYLISFQSIEPGATIASRSGIRILFSKGDYWFEGKFTLDKLFQILRPHLGRKKVR